jgi:LysM repeat protein/ABC-type branched-subunit amino acid transport system substrate-binding protein
MKGIVRHIVRIVMAAALSATAAHGQGYVSTPVEISKEKVRIEGKICYSHIVLEKQTLYSISKAYEVSLEDIYRFNPTLKENGLKKNSIIIIPSKDALKSETEPAVTASPEPAEKKVVKNVERKEEKAAENKEKTQRIHIAKWYEDLDVISEQYGVPVEDIMAANNLKGRKLNKRHRLIIPYPGEKIEKPQEEETATAMENAPEISEAAVAKIDSVEVLQPKNEVSATILMPLTTDNGEPNRNNMDFYCGALLAVYDLANEGISCKLNVLDTHTDEPQRGIEGLTNSDVIIGPVSTADLTRLFSAIGENTLVVSPLDPRAEKLVVSHGSMVHVPTPQSTQYRDLVNWLEEDFKEGDRVVLITEKGARQSVVSTVMKEAMDSSSLEYKTFSYSILEGRDVSKPLTELMSSMGTNRILISSESEAFVNDVIRNLNLLIYNNIDITIYASSKIRGFETIEVENLHKTSMHVSLAYYIDYENTKVKDFLKKYRALYNTEPNQFAFQGYDVARYFIELCARYGYNWKQFIEDNDSSTLQSMFKIRKQAIGGYTNSGVRRIVYENGYSVKPVR